MKDKNLIIIGATEFAEIAYEYFMEESEYRVVAFAVDAEYIVRDTLKNIPVIPLEKVFSDYPPEEFELFTAVTYKKINGLRRDFYNKGKERGYSFATFVSPAAFVWKNVSVGEDVFIFENNTIQYNARIGNGVVIWSGNHIGHSAVIDDFCFISSHVVVSGYTRIGEKSFCGVNSTIANNICIAPKTIMGAGSVITKDIKVSNGVYVGNPAVRLNKKAESVF